MDEIINMDFAVLAAALIVVISVIATLWY